MAKLATTFFCCLLLIFSWPNESSSHSSHKLMKSWQTFDLALSLYFGMDAGKKVKEYLKNTDSEITESDRFTISNLNQFSQDIQETRNAILFKISDQLYSKLSENLKTIFQAAADVEFVYKRYINIFTSMRNRSRHDLLDFSKANTLHQNNLINGFERILFRMHELLIRGDDTVESTLRIINKESSQLGHLSSRKESAQQLIKELYDLVINTHVKGLQIRKFCFSYRQEYEKQNFQQSIDDDLKHFKEQVNRTYEAVKAAMEKASRDIYNCDPAMWERGTNYEQLGPVFQTHIVQSTDLPEDGGSCGTKKQKHLYRSDQSRLLEVDKRCHQGHMRNCQPFVKEFQVCYSHKSSPRIFDWVKSSQNNIYGYKNITNCSNMTLHQSLNSLQKLGGANHCLCICDSGRRAEDRYFSLQSVESDYAKNKVITGAQIVKIGRVFYIKIQEGELGPNGTIIGKPVWKGVPEDLQKSQWKTISEFASSTSKTRIPHTSVYKDEIRKYVFNTEFFKNVFLHPVTFDWRKVNLDEYILEPNEVLTGLRFNKKGSVLVLEIQARTYDYKTGKLIKRLIQNNKYIRWTKSKFDGVRQEVLLSEPDVPISVDPRGELEIYDNGKFVQFTTTDNGKDMGQNTVPFIDIQPVTTNPPMPLSGAGLILKRKGKSGGFLALKLNHFDLVL